MFTASLRILMMMLQLVWDTGSRPTGHYYMFWSSISWRGYIPPSSLMPVHIYLFRGVLQPQEDEDGRLCRYLCILNDAPNDVLWRRIKVHGNLSG